MYNIIGYITGKYINKQYADHQYHDIKEFFIHIISNVEFFNDFTVTDNKLVTNLRICAVTNNESLQIYEFSFYNFSSAVFLPQISQFPKNY